MRLPPNQTPVERFQVYAALGIPEIDLKTWRLKVGGLVEKALSLSYRELLSMKLKRVEGGFHCVEGWSVLKVVWEGVEIRELAKRARVSPEAEWVIFHSVDGYSAPSPIEYSLRNDSIIALRMNGAPIPLEHGFPARPILPDLYAWKSVKWLTEIEFTREYVDGYWEKRGYHWRGDVWKEERMK